MKRNRMLLFTVCIALCLCIFAITSFAADTKEYTSGPLTYSVLEDGTVKITKYAGTEKTYTVPSEIDGKNVSTIGSYAFSYIADLETLTIPGNVSKLERWAIHGCQKLKTVTIKEGKLTNLNSNFESCSSLKTVNLPKNIESLAVFMQCKALEKIEIATDNPYLCDVDGVVFSKDKKTLIRYPAGKKTEKYEVPSSVKEIKNSSFYEVSLLKSIFIPETVTSIEETAFAYTKFTIYTDAASAPKAWKSAFSGRTVKYNCSLSAYRGGESTESAVTNPAKPKSVTATPSASAVKLSWEKVKDANGYAVFQYISGKWKRIKTITSADTVSYKVKELKSGTVYKFRIKAYKKVNGQTLWSSATPTIKVTTKLAKPDKISLSQTDSSITLKWGKVTGANGYAVFRYTSGEWKRVKTITSPSTVSYTVKKLKAGQTLKFRIKAYKKADGKTLWSSATSTITAATKPSMTTVTAKSEGPGQITLSWKAVSGAKLYKVYYKVNDGKFKLYKDYTKPQKLTFNNLNGGDKYTFAVKAAINVTGGTVIGEAAKKSVKVTYRTPGYLNAMKSGDFLLTTVCDGVGTTTAIKGNNIYADTYDYSDEEARITMFYLGNQQRWYYVSHNDRAYTTVDDKDLPLEGRGTEVLKARKNEKVPTSYKTEKDRINGQTVFRETVKQDDCTISYYYSGTRLIQVDTDYGYTIVSETVIEFTDDVPASLFEVPDDYKYIS